MKPVIFLMIAFAMSKLGGSAPAPVLAHNPEECKPDSLIQWGDMIFEDNDKFLEEIRKRALENRVLLAELRKIDKPKQLTSRAENSLTFLKASVDVIKSEALKTESSAIDLNEKTLQLLDEMRNSNINLGGFGQKIEEYKTMAAKNIEQAESSKENVLQSYAAVEFEKTRLDETVKEIDALNVEGNTKGRVFTERLSEVKRMIKKWEAIDKCRKRLNRTH